MSQSNIPTLWKQKTKFSPKPAKPNKKKQKIFHIHRANHPQKKSDKCHTCSTYPITKYNQCYYCNYEQLGKYGRAFTRWSTYTEFLQKKQNQQT